MLPFWRPSSQPLPSATRLAFPFLPANGKVATASIVRMPMVEVRKVRMSVHEPCVPVPVRVRLARRMLGLMRMLMVLVVYVRVLVLDRLMRMLVLVPLG
jgi:hypothetical protein